MEEQVNQNILTLFDRRVGKIEDGQDNLSKQMQHLSAQMQSQAETLSQMSNALTAVVRLEERLTSYIEKGREQNQSIQRVHNRLDETLEVLAEHAKNIREQFNSQAHYIDTTVDVVYQRVEAERKDCQERFQPINDKMHKQEGALRFASVVFPVIASVVISIGGWWCSQMNSDIRDLTTRLSKHENDAVTVIEQVKQIRKDIDTKVIRVP